MELLPSDNYRLTVLVFLSVAIVFVGFGYGYLAHKFQLPPHAQIRSTFETLMEYPWLRSAWFSARDLLVEDSSALRHWHQKPPEARGDSPLDGLGYFRSYRRLGDTAGVIRHEPERVQPGLQLVVSAHEPAATLMTVDGRAIHQWKISWKEAFPDKVPFRRPGRKKTKFWRRVRVRPDGTLVAIFQGQGIVKLDRRSQLIWSRHLQTQNDLKILPDGSIYVITKKYKTVPSISADRKVEEYFLTRLSPDGKVRKRISLLDALDRSPYSALLQQGLNEGDNAFHTNTVHILDQVPRGLPPGFRRGNVLLSFPKLNAIAVLNPTRKKISWLMAGMFRYQHNPRLLNNGNLLLFDNLGHDGFSRVIEFSPATQNIVWAYEGTEENGFRSRCCGTSQRLPNGNTLITDSTNGRAFEVTQDGTLVWEYINPGRVGRHNRYIATLFQLQRLPKDYFTDWITTGESPDGSVRNQATVKK